VGLVAVISEAAVIALGVAAIGAFGSFYAFRASRQTKTNNGHSLGSLVEDMAERLARMEVWMVEHLRDHAHHGERR